MQLYVHKLDTFMERIALDKMFGNDIQKVYSCKATASNLYHYVLSSTSRVKFKILWTCGVVESVLCWELHN